MDARLQDLDTSDHSAAEDSESEEGSGLSDASDGLDDVLCPRCWPRVHGFCCRGLSTGGVSALLQGLNFTESCTS